MKNAVTTRTRVVGWAIAGVTVALVAGCSADEDRSTADPTATPDVVETSPEPNPETDSESAALEVWNAGDYDEVIRIYGEVVVALKSGEPEMLHGLDVATGEVLWEAPTSRGSIAASSRFPLLTLETAEGEPLLVNVTPPGWDEVEQYSFHGLELLDPVAGTQVKDLGRAWVAGRWNCPIVGGVCVRLRLPGNTDESVPYRIDPQTLELEHWDEAEIGEFVTYRSYGGGVYGVEMADGTNSLVGMTAGQEQWRVLAADVFGDGAVVVGRIVAGSNVINAEDVVVLSGAFHADFSDASQVSSDSFTTVGIDTDSGEVLWTTEGQVACRVGVLCSGEWNYVRDGDSEAYQVESGEVTLRGFDVRSGEELWATEPAELEGIVNSGTTEGFAFAEDMLYVALDGEAQVVALETGDMAPLGDDYGPCYRPINEDRYDRSNPFADRVPTRVGGEHYLCNDAGQAPADAAFTESVVDSLGAGTWRPEEQRDQDLPAPRIHVVNTTNGLVGFEF